MIRTSVIIPVFNGEKYLEYTLESLLANITADDQVIVIDDGSTDQSQNIIKKYSNFRLIHGKQLGPSKARNLGLSKARGEFITFLDHDDLWPEGRLNQHIELLERKSESQIDVVVGRTQYLFDNQQNTNKYNFLSSDNSLHHVHLGASTFRRKIFEGVGFFDTTLRYSEDHDLFLKIREKNYKLFYDNNIALQYRVHDTNMSGDKSLKELQVFQVLHNSLKRRRLNNQIETNLNKFGG